MWVPPDLAKEGITERILFLLRDMIAEPIRRNAPPPQSSVVYDRAYEQARDMGLIVFRRADPNVCDLANDHFYLTDAGRAVLGRNDSALAALGRTK